MSLLSRAVAKIKDALVFLSQHRTSSHRLGVGPEDEHGGQAMADRQFGHTSTLSDKKRT
jgi:hypothetical protein